MFMRVSVEVMGLYFGAGALVHMVLALYFAFVFVDVLHRFHGFRNADLWIWLRAGCFCAMYCVSTVGFLAGNYLPVNLYDIGLYHLPLIAGYLCSLGIFLALAQLPKFGLFRLGEIYRWLLAMTAVLGLAEVIALLAFDPFMLFVTAAMSWSADIAYFVTAIVFILILHRASKAVRSMPTAETRGTSSL